MRKAYPICFLSLSVDVFGGQTFVFTALLHNLSRKEKEFSRILSNMKAYVIVRGFVANIRNIVDDNDQKLFTFSVANDLVRADRLF